MNSIIKYLIAIFFFLVGVFFNLFGGINLNPVLSTVIFIVQIFSIFLFSASKNFYIVHSAFLISYVILLPLTSFPLRIFSYTLLLILPAILFILKYDNLKVFILFFTGLILSSISVFVYFDSYRIMFYSIILILNLFTFFAITRERGKNETVKKQLDNVSAKNKLIDVSPFMPDKERVMDDESAYSRRIVNQIEDAVFSIVELASKCMKTRTALFIMYDRINDTLYPENGVSSLNLALKKPITSKNNLLYWIARNKELISDNLFVGDPLLFGIYETPSVIRSIIGVPVMYKGSISGILYLDDESEGRFTLQDIENAKLFANQISRIFNFAQYAEQAKTEATYLSVLNDIAHRLSTTLVYGEILDIISSTVNKIISPENIFVVSIEREIGILKYHNMNDARLLKEFNCRNTFLQLSLQEDDVFIKNKISSREVPLPILYDGEPLKKIRSAISFPILSDNGRREFLIGVSKKDDFELGAGGEIILNFISDIAKTALVKSILYEKTKELSIKDGLTNLYNHRYFQDELSKMILNAKRVEHKMALALIDIDFFKKFNDTYGHQTGDAVLKHLAEILLKSIRETDLVARYGGEEFVVVLSNVTNSSAKQVFENIRKKVEESPVDSSEADQKLKITVSIGYAIYPENADMKIDLIKHADEALYIAKKNGRNRVQEYFRNNP